MGREVPIMNRLGLSLAVSVAGLAEGAMIGRILGCVVVVVLALQHEAAGQCEHQKLVASNGNSGDR